MSLNTHVLLNVIKSQSSIQIMPYVGALGMMQNQRIDKKRSSLLIAQEHHDPPGIEHRTSP